MSLRRHKTPRNFYSETFWFLQISETFDHLSIFWFWWTFSCPDRFYRVRRSRSSGPCWNEAVTDRLWPWFFLSACICDGKVALHMEMKFYQQGQNIKCINCVVINPEKELWFVHSKRKKSLQFSLVHKNILSPCIDYNEINRYRFIVNIEFSRIKVSWVYILLCKVWIIKVW